MCESDGYWTSLKRTERVIMMRIFGAIEDYIIIIIIKQSLSLFICLSLVCGGRGVGVWLELAHLVDRRT